MCGIVGYVGPKSTLEVLIGGLRRLEYRGYDSAGVSVIAKGQLETRKKAGKLNNLVAEIEAHPLPTAHIGIGHTRWATHGAPTDGNAHPHLGGATSKLSLIHNGIIENFAELKAELLASGTNFSSETDSEVAAHLIAKAFERTGELVAAFTEVVNRLHGAFTILVIDQDQPDVVLAARRNAPLVIGLGERENFLGSDVAAFVEHTKRAIAVGQDQIVILRAESVEVIGFDGKPAETEEFEVDWDASAASKGGWPSFMAKEIADQPQSIADTLMGRLSHDGRVSLGDLAELSTDYIKNIDRIVIVACGTASYAGDVGKYAIEKWSRIPVSVELSHEFRYRNPIVTPKPSVTAAETPPPLPAQAVAAAVASPVATVVPAAPSPLVPVAASSLSKVVPQDPWKGLREMGLLPPTDLKGEFALGSWWAVRVGGALAVASVVFLAIWLNLRSTLPAWVRLGEILALGGLGLWGGQRLEQSRRDLGRVVFAVGLTVFQFAAWASYGMEKMRVLETPAQAAVLQFFVALVVGGVALARKDKLIGQISIIFATVATCLSVQAGSDALTIGVEAGSIAALGAVLLSRGGWASSAVLGLAGSVIGLLLLYEGRPNSPALTLAVQLGAGLTFLSLWLADRFGRVCRC